MGTCVPICYASRVQRKPNRYLRLNPHTLCAIINIPHLAQSNPWGPWFSMYILSSTVMIFSIPVRTPNLYIILCIQVETIVASFLSPSFRPVVASMPPPTTSPMGVGLQSGVPPLARDRVDASLKKNIHPYLHTFFTTLKKSPSIFPSISLFPSSYIT